MRTQAWGEGGSSKCVQMRAWEGGGGEALRAHDPRTLEFAHVVQEVEIFSTSTCPF